METINGEWIMKGCSRTDKNRLHSPGDLLDLIQKIGFLPLFSNMIPGFSVEEHTLAADWWTDNPATDPWAWRQILASNDHVAYGKFFEKKAGFVSREWFPDFANYRRNGYDYEGMYEEGRMPGRSRKVLEALELNEEAVGLEMMSCDLRKKASMEKGFEWAAADLQMHAFLIMSDFRQKRNKHGETYGWHVATLMTPETKWGYNLVNSSEVSPEKSWEKISVQIKKNFPGAEDSMIQKTVGIRF